MLQTITCTALLSLLSFLIIALLYWLIKQEIHETRGIGLHNLHTVPIRLAIDQQAFCPSQNILRCVQWGYGRCARFCGVHSRFLRACRMIFASIICSNTRSSWGSCCGYIEGSMFLQKVLETLVNGSRSVLYDMIRLPTTMKCCCCSMRGSVSSFASKLRRYVGAGTTIKKHWIAFLLKRC